MRIRAKCLRLAREHRRATWLKCIRGRLYNALSNCRHSILYELASGHLLVDVGKMKIRVEQEQRIADSVDDIWYLS
jgi:hypothetical protein